MRSNRGRAAPFVALAIAVVCAALFVVLAGADADDGGESARTPLLDRPAPEAIGEEADGTTFDLARRKGSWVVLNFFDPTCVPCVEEHPELVAFHEQELALGADGAELVTVVFRDDRDGVAEFFADEGGDWPVVYDDDGSIAAAFGVTKVPETWVVDPNGIVVFRTIDKVTASQLDAVIDRLSGRRT
jgi:cytochrome c biogenesis protein CcmG, thiol:disulfide interchange protein DsbE